jgi:SRSO17 transposase
MFVETISGGVAAAFVSIDVAGWVEEFACGFAAIAGRFRRREPRLQARSFLLGVLSDVDTRSCWQLAEQAGDSDPNATQRLLGEAVWDADAVRDDVRGYVIDAIGHRDGVLILDDTGDLKRGIHTVGVQRQYTGTAGRIENAQVSVFLAYASPAGRALIDRAIYLPLSWTDDPDRCAATGIPADVTFATKITLGRRMLQRACDAGVPAAWATADEFYGRDRGLRRDLQARRLGYVLAVANSHRVNIGGLHGVARADRIAANLGKKAWNRYSAGQGAKGRREYDWAWVAVIPPPDEATGFHWLLGDGLAEEVMRRVQVAEPSGRGASHSQPRLVLSRQALPRKNRTCQVSAPPCSASRAASGRVRVSSGVVRFMTSRTRRSMSGSVPS